MAQPMFPIDTPMTRRTLMESCAAVLLASAASAQSGSGKAKLVFQHDLPDVTLKGWSVTVVEVNYEAWRELCRASPPRHHHRLRPRGGNSFQDRRRS